jgi:hypothetical protein
MENLEQAWAFTKGAALWAGAVGYWASQPEPTPNMLVEFIHEQIEFWCRDNARHGRAGMRWVDDVDPLTATVAQTICAAAAHAGVRVRPHQIAAACCECGVRPDDPLHVIADEAAAVAAKIWP